MTLKDVIEEGKRPSPPDEPCGTLLEGLQQEEVQRIASAWKLPDAARYYKSELVGVMSEFLATGQGHELLLSPLPAPSRELYDFLEQATGTSAASQVRMHFGWEERDLRAALLPLAQRALVWD